MAFELPEDPKDLDLKDETHGDANWKRVKESELDWLHQLRAAVGQGTVQTVLDAVSEILLSAIPGTVHRPLRPRLGCTRSPWPWATPQLLS